MAESGSGLKQRLFGGGLHQASRLLQMRFIDLAFIVIGASGLFVSLYLVATQHVRTQAREALVRRQAFQEQQLREAQEEIRRQEALKAQALREAEERKTREADARQKLTQEGVRSVELPSASAELPSSVGVSLALQSDPEHADVFLDWRPKGRTPLRLEGISITGFLLVTKNGYQPWFREVNAHESTTFSLSLPLEETYPRTRLLLIAADTAPHDVFPALSTRLADEGFTVVGLEEAQEFQRAVSQAGGLSHVGLRAWARATCGTDTLVTAHIRQSSRELSAQPLPQGGVREALAGTMRSEVTIELAVHDLRSGHHLTTVSGQGAAFALDRLQSLNKALVQGYTDAAQKLRVWTHDRAS